MVNKENLMFFVSIPAILAVLFFIFRFSGVPSRIPHNISDVLIVAGLLPLGASIFAERILKRTNTLFAKYNFSITGSLFFALIYFMYAPPPSSGPDFSFAFLPALLSGLFFVAALASLAVSLLTVLFPNLDKEIF